MTPNPNADDRTESTTNSSPENEADLFAEVRSTLKNAKRVDGIDRVQTLKGAAGELQWLSARRYLQVEEVEAELMNAFAAPDDEVPYFINRALEALEDIESAAPKGSEWRLESPHSGSAAVKEDSMAKRLNIDLETADDPYAELSEALRQLDEPPWELDVLVQVDGAVARRYRAAFEQALADPEKDFFDLVYNYGKSNVSIAIDGEDPEYYFREQRDESSAEEGE
jgi:hypothetical protein